MDWITWAQNAGIYASPLLMGAVFWLNTDRNRLIADLKVKDDQIMDLAERVIVVSTELKTYLFNERKT